MSRLVSAAIILCYYGDFASCTTRKILVNFPNAVLNAKRFYNHLKFLVD